MDMFKLAFESPKLTRKQRNAKRKYKAELKAERVNNPLRATQRIDDQAAFNDGVSSQLDSTVIVKKGERRLLSNSPITKGRQKVKGKEIAKVTEYSPRRNEVYTDSEAKAIHADLRNRK